MSSFISPVHFNCAFQPCISTVHFNRAFQLPNTQAPVSLTHTQHQPPNHCKTAPPPLPPSAPPSAGTPNQPRVPNWWRDLPLAAAPPSPPTTTRHACRPWPNDASPTTLPRAGSRLLSPTKKHWKGRRKRTRRGQKEDRKRIERGQEEDRKRTGRGNKEERKRKGPITCSSHFVFALHVV
jgi:hypothetical protein